MKFLHTKAFTGLIFFILGATSMVTVQRFILKPKYTHSAPLVSSKQMDPFFDRFFNDDFFGRSRDPFEDLRQMREGMMKQFDHDQGVGLFDSWYKKKFGGGSAGDIKQREDSHFVYYDISIDGLKGDKVDVKVENGQVNILGQVEKKSEEEGTNSYFSSTFHRSFPAPPDVDANKVQIDQEKTKVVVMFPKVR